MEQIQHDERRSKPLMIAVGVFILLAAVFIFRYVTYPMVLEPFAKAIATFIRR